MVVTKTSPFLILSNSFGELIICTGPIACPGEAAMPVNNGGERWEVGSGIFISSSTPEIFSRSEDLIVVIGRVWTI